MKKKKELHLLIATFITLCFTACVNQIDDDEAPPADGTNASLNIQTRTTTSNLAPTLPIHIYAFDSKAKCVATQSLTKADETISLELPTGSYKVYALTGANTSNYNLPSRGDAVTTATVALKNPSDTHDELEAGNATITLEDGQSTNLMITVTRIVASVTASVSGLDNSITEVTMSIEPLYKEVKLDGTYTQDTNGKITFPLKKQSGGTWNTPAPFFILPGEGNATVTISLTDAAGTRNYAYNSTIKVKANYELKISAQYTETNGPDINGNISSTDWEGEEHISFDFGPGSTQGKDDDDETTGELPKVGDLYKDCYVLAVNDATAQSAKLLLISPRQWNDVLRDNATTTIAGYSVNGLTDWELPNRSQAELIYNQRASIPGINLNDEYLLNDNGTIKSFHTGDLFFDPASAYAKTSYYVRAVKNLTITIQ